MNKSHTTSWFNSHKSGRFSSTMALLQLLCVASGDILLSQLFLTQVLCSYAIHECSHWRHPTEYSYGHFHLHFQVKEGPNVTMGILRSDKIVELTQDATTSRFYTAITSAPLKIFDQTHYLLMQNQKTSNEKHFFVLSNPCSHTSSSKGGNDNNTFDEIPTLEDSLDLKNNRARISIVDVNIEEIYYPYTVLFSNNQSSDWLTDSNSIQLPPLGIEKIVVDVVASESLNDHTRTLELSMRTLSQGNASPPLPPRNVAVFVSLGREIMNSNEFIPRIISVHENPNATWTLWPFSSGSTPSPPFIPPSLPPQQQQQHPYRNIPKSIDRLYIWLQCVNGFTEGCPLRYRLSWKLNNSSIPIASNSQENSSTIAQQPPPLPSTPPAFSITASNGTMKTETDISLPTIIGTVLGLVGSFLLAAFCVVFSIIAVCLLRKKRKVKNLKSSSTLFHPNVPSLILPPPIHSEVFLENGHDIRPSAPLEEVVQLERYALSLMSDPNTGMMMHHTQIPLHSNFTSLSQQPQSPNSSSSNFTSASNERLVV